MQVRTRERHVLAGWLLVAAAAVAAPAPSSAQDKPLSITLGGAVVGPLSDSADRFSPGPGATVGAAWALTEQAVVRFDLLWSRFGAQDDWPKPPLALQVGVKPRFQFASAAFMFQAPPGRVRAYILAGAGLYRRSVTLASSGAGSVSVCDPYWFVCEPGEVSAGRLSGSRSSTDLGVNVGVGVRSGMFFAEIRYHSTWGPEYAAPAGRTRATGRFLPLTVGVMF